MGMRICIFETSAMGGLPGVEIETVRLVGTAALICETIRPRPHQDVDAAAETP